jgi:NADP-dependent 3-hydroxy acid dehydrogenase YdfG
LREFQGRRAVITGAGSGIGKALVQELLTAGAHVLATDISKENLEALRQATEELPGTLHIHPGDVSDWDSMTELKDRADQVLGHVDFLFNNAGVAYNTLPTWQAPEVAVRWSYDVNVYGVLNGIRAFVPPMVERGAGHIVNTASIGGFQVSRRTDVWQQGLYASTKYAVVAISEALDIELAGSGIDVSILAPSAVATGIARSGEHRQARYGGAGDDASPKAMAAMLAEDGMQPELVAKITLAGVLNKQLYIFTDGSLRDRIRERHASIEKAFENILSMDVTA